MTTDDSEGLAQLRRVAYGRAHTPEELAAAAAAREALAAAEARETEVVTPEPDPEPAPVPAADDAAEPVATRHAWAVPAVIALVIGAIAGGAGATFAGGQLVAEPAPTPTFTPGSSARPAAMIPVTTNSSFISGPGDLVAAEHWFSGTQTDEDITTLFRDGSIFLPETTRLVLSTKDDDVWLAKSADGGLCLVIGSSDLSGGASCVAPEDFVSTGLMLSQNHMQVAWDGVRFAATSTAP